MIKFKRGSKKMNSPPKASNIYSICRPQKLLQVRRIRCLVSLLKHLTKMHYWLKNDIYIRYCSELKPVSPVKYICLDSQAAEDEEKVKKPTAAKAKPCPKPKPSPIKPAEKHPAPSPDKTASPETAKASSQVPKRVRGKQATDMTELQQMKEAPTYVM